MRIVNLAFAAALLPGIAFAQTTTSTANGVAQSGSEAVVAPTYNSYSPSRINDNVPAPDMVIEGANVCALPVSASASFLGIAGGIAATPVDHGCEGRDDAAAMLALGRKDVAMAIMCQQADVKKGAASLGMSCGDLVKQSTARPVVQVVSTQAAFCSTLNPSSPEDRPYITQCMKH